MSKAIDTFKANIARVRDLGSLYAAVQRLTTSSLDVSDLLRAQLVFVVSALDTYVHEVVLEKMIDIYTGARKASSRFGQFSVSLGSLPSNSIGNNGSSWLEVEIKQKHKWSSFQHPDKISDAIHLVSDLSLWVEVGRKMGMATADVKTELGLIVDRRNKISHEADINPTVPGERWSIDAQSVEQAVRFVECVVESIDDILN